MKFVDKALDVVEATYGELNEIAKDMLDPFFKPVDNIISNLGNNINNLSIETIRNVILELSLSSYKIGEIKDKTGIKAEIAEAVKKEKWAITHNSTEGTVATKENTALLESSPEIATEILYDLVSSLTKTKVDELHRIISALTSVLMSRMSEAKLTSMLSLDNSSI